MIKRFPCSSAHCLEVQFMDDSKVPDPATWRCDTCREERARSPIPSDPLFGDESLNKLKGITFSIPTMCGSSPTALNVEDAPRDWRGDNMDLSKGGVKYDTGKPALELVAPEFLLGVADVLTYGANKYLPRNWEAGMRWGRPLGALLRHILSWMGGEEVDKESGKHHLDHAACCLMFLRAYVARKIGEDDRKRIFE